MDHPTPDAEATELDTDAVDRAEEPHGAGADAPVRRTLQRDAGQPIGPPPKRPLDVLRDPPEAARPPVAPLPPLAPTESHPSVGTKAPAIHPVEVHRDRTRASTALVGIVSGVLAAALTVGGLAVAGIFDRPETVVQEITLPAPDAQPPTQIIVEGNGTSTASAVANKVVPSIVAVEVASDNGNDTFSTFGSGSGVILTSDGLIVTNHHVIADADLAQVVLQTGEIYQAEVIGSDRITDLAVLKIDVQGLVPVEIGSTADLAIGDQAVAVGNPLGLPGGASVTVGVVSAFDREVQVSTEDRLFGMLQTDAPITRGSSGGALVDALGRLIGITTAIGVTDAGAEGVGFAIPVELMRRITDEIIEKGHVRHTFLGVLLQDHLEPRGGAQVPEGATIIDFVDPSGAQDAGLQVGDRLTVINGRTVRTKEDIINELREFRVGDTITLSVLRDGVVSEVDVILGERPEEPQEQE